MHKSRILRYLRQSTTKVQHTLQSVEMYLARLMVSLAVLVNHESDHDSQRRIVETVGSTQLLIDETNRFFQMVKGQRCFRNITTYHTTPCFRYAEGAMENWSYLVTATSMVRRGGTYKLRRMSRIGTRRIFRG